MLGRHLLFFAALLLAPFPSAARAESVPATGTARDRYDTAGGVTVGLPQIIALTWEKEIESHLRFQANVGSAVAITSMSARMIAVVDQHSVQPYAFMGVGFLTAAMASEGAVIPYGWYGVGLRLKIDRVILFVETGTVAVDALSRDDDGGSAPAGALGLLVEY